VVWEKLKPTTPSFITDVVSYFIPPSSSAATQQIAPVGKQLDLGGFDLNYTADVTSVIKAKSTGGDVLKSPDGSSKSSISMLQGDKGNDIIRGGAGSDLIDAGAGNDIIKAGDGDDIITGGSGADQIWGGFGKNVFLNEKDGSIDRLFITSDQYVPNPNLDNRASNNTDGHNVDTIKSLDSFDKINILGVSTQDLSFFQTVAPSGSQGIGIYAKGTLEAIYTGGDLSTQQIRSMTTGLASGYSDVINSI
jgi:Ca2+-binding RTX toxin-like protein